MKTLPSLKQLEYLTALAQTVHFGRAADLCNVTPSTLSAGIRDLEVLLGAPVAERTKRTVIMTALGLEIASAANRLLGDAEQIMAMAQPAAGPLCGDLKLGVIPTIGPFLLPHAVRHLHAKFPDLRLQLQEAKTTELLELLAAGRLDIALIALPFQIDAFGSKILFEDQFRFACPDSHALSGKPEISLNDIATDQLMLLEEGHCLRGHALSACHINPAQKRMDFEATSIHTLVQMVGMGLGVTLLPQISIDAGVLKGTGIRHIPLADAASRQIGLVWRKATTRFAEFQLLGDELQQVHETQLHADIEG